jgi:hypothetical protein
MMRQPLCSIAVNGQLRRHPDDPPEKRLLHETFQDPTFCANLKKARADAQKEDKDRFRTEAPERRFLWKQGQRWHRVVRSGGHLYVYEGEPRDYTSTVLPTLAKAPHTPEAEQTLLLTMYKEVGSNWRALTEVRFKLLGFVPAVSVAIWVQLLAANMLKTLPGTCIGFFLAVVGFYVTHAMWSYDQRNDGLYDDLISRGRKLEEELGVDTGIFRGRLRAYPSKHNHRTAVQRIYNSVKLGWIIVGLWFVYLSLIHWFPYLSLIQTTTLDV